MNWEQEVVIDDVRQRLSKIRKIDDNGEVDFRLLAMLAESRDGWLGRVMNALYSAFAEDSETGKPEEFLVELSKVLKSVIESLCEDNSWNESTIYLFSIFIDIYKFSVSFIMIKLSGSVISVAIMYC